MDQQRCRCCLNAESQQYFNLFEKYKTAKTFAESIHFIADVEVEREDGLPQIACTDCYSELQNIVEFGFLIRQTDKKLRNELEHYRKMYSAEAADAAASLECKVVTDEDYIVAEDEDNIQVCILEDEVIHVSDVANEQTELCLAEYIKDDHNIQMVEEVLELDDHNAHISHPSKVSLKGDLLSELAQVAATHETAIADKSTSCIQQDECDEDYLTEYNAEEEAFYNFKPPKWKCGECKVVLRGDVSYEGHMNIHKKLHPHKCAQCGQQFRCRSALKRHKDLRHMENAKSTNEEVAKKTEESLPLELKCFECQETCQSDIELFAHELIIHDKNSHLNICPFCSEDTLGHMISHLQTDHNVKQTVCIEEGTESAYENQSLSSASTTLWPCETCAKTFQSIDDLQQHRKLCHASDEGESTAMDEYVYFVNIVDTMVECHKCNKKVQKKNLSRHMESHERRTKKADEEEKKFLCAYCPREFKNNKSLHQHEKTHQGEAADTVYVCGDCDRQYASQFLLETHRKQAHKERDHVCSVCGNAFKLKNQLMNHMKLHFDKTIECPHCDKKYARQFDLNVHLRSHTGELPYACHLCDKRFAIKVRLTYHLQKHYGVRHQCKECHAEFNSKQKLKAHSFKHTGMPYRCELCDDHGFANRVVFKRHLSRVHHGSMTDEALNEMFQRNTGKTTKIKQVQEQYILTETEQLTEETTVLINSSDIIIKSD